MEDCGLIVAWPERSRRADECEHDTTLGRPKKCSSSGPKKCVSFDPRTDVRLIDKVEEMSFEEISRVWYSDEEYVQIEKEVKFTLKFNMVLKKKGERAMEEQRELADKLCMRGLEYVAHASVLKERRILKDAVVEAVLDEQERQLENQMRGQPYNDEAIADASSAASKSSCDLARSMGALDAATTLSYRFAEALDSKSSPDPAALQPHRQGRCRSLWGDPGSAKINRSVLREAPTTPNAEEGAMRGEVQRRKSHEDLPRVAPSLACRQSASDVTFEMPAEVRSVSNAPNKRANSLPVPPTPVDKSNPAALSGMNIFSLRQALVSLQLSSRSKILGGGKIGVKGWGVDDRLPS